MPLVVIEGKKCGSAPINVVDWALREQSRAKRNHEPFDVVWCVFDRDQHQSFSRAIAKAESKNARRVREYDTSGTPYPNPSTRVGELVSTCSLLKP